MVMSSLLATKSACKEWKARENSALFVCGFFLHRDRQWPMAQFKIGKNTLYLFLGHLIPVSALKKEIGFLLLVQI